MKQFRVSSYIQTHVRSLIEPDLRSARDDQDLKCRLARNGYGFRDTTKGRVLVTLPHGVEVMTLH